MPAKQKVHPALQPCPKCAGADILRKYRRNQEKWTLAWRDRDSRITNKYVRYADYEACAAKECISHHCRICQYQWDGPCHNGD